MYTRAYTYTSVHARVCMHTRAYASTYTRELLNSSIVIYLIAYVGMT